VSEVTISSENSCNNSCDRVCCQGENCGEVCCKEPCIDPCVNVCTLKCSDSCDQCSDSCTQSCCDSCCQSGCCDNTSTAFIGLMTFMAVILCNIIVGIIDAFYSQGPILITLFGSICLAFNLTGINFVSNKEKKVPFCKNRSSSRWGRLQITHSHHSLAQCQTGHEFKLGKKYFCTGCYGILLGSTLAIAFFATYLLDAVDYSFLTSYSLIIPMFSLFLI